MVRAAVHRLRGHLAANRASQVVHRHHGALAGRVASLEVTLHHQVHLAVINGPNLHMEAEMEGIRRPSLRIPNHHTPSHHTLNHHLLPRIRIQNHPTLSHRTLSHRTLNHRTLNHRILNHRILNQVTHLIRVKTMDTMVATGVNGLNRNGALPQVAHHGHRVAGSQARAEEAHREAHRVAGEARAVGRVASLVVKGI